MTLVWPMDSSLRRRGKAQGEMVSLSGRKVFQKTVEGMASRGTLKVSDPSADNLL